MSQRRWNLVSVRGSANVTFHPLEITQTASGTDDAGLLPLAQVLLTPDNTLILTVEMPDTRMIAAPVSDQHRRTLIWRWNPDLAIPMWQNQLQAEIISAPLGIALPIEIIPYDGYDGTFFDHFYIDGTNPASASTIPLSSNILQDVQEVRIPWNANHPNANKRHLAPAGRIAHRHSGSPAINLAFAYKGRLYTGTGQLFGKVPLGLRKVGYKRMED